MMRNLLKVLLIGTVLMSKNALAVFIPTTTAGGGQLITAAGSPGVVSPMATAESAAVAGGVGIEAGGGGAGYAAITATAETEVLGGAGAGAGAGGAGAGAGAGAGGAGGGTAGGTAASGGLSLVLGYGMTTNPIPYVLMILEAKEGNKLEDATKEVTVKGAEPMQDSQGSQSGGASSNQAPLPPEVAMSGTSIGGAASAMINLLKSNTIDLSLLSTSIEKPKEETQESTPVRRAIRASSSSSQAGIRATQEVVSAQTTPETGEEKRTAEEQTEIMHRRSLLLGEWAAAATQIGEGSNAISSDFYARSAAFAAAANAASGSLGGINTITDTDRFVLFELTRGAALSAIQLGLQGAVNLNSLEEIATPEQDSSYSPRPGISASSSSSQ